MSPQLADSEFSPVFRLLTIFAYGTYADYLGEAARASRPGAGDPAGGTRGAEGLPPSPAARPSPRPDTLCFGPQTRGAPGGDQRCHLPPAKEHPGKGVSEGPGQRLGYPLGCADPRK